MLDGKEKPPVVDVAPSRTLSIARPDGSKLHVEIYGEATRPTLLLTHGWSLDTSAWKYIKADLLDRYRIVAWDLPGLGRSRGPSNKDYSLEKMAHDLAAVLQATAEKGSPVILLGHSIGGMILQVFCRVHRDQLDRTVKGLALVHTTYTNPLRTITAAPLASALEKPLIVPMNYLTIALSGLAWLSNWQSYFNGSLHVWTRLVSFSGKQSRAQIDHGARLAAVAWPATVARGNLAMMKFDEQATLGQVQVPVLVIAGDHDRITLRSASEHIERLLPNERATHIDGGHLGYWEVSEQAVELIRDFADHVTAAESPAHESLPTPAAVQSKGISADAQPEAF
jgi:pimeloyl-ACP methyl ester carboxylesterase